MPLQLKFALPEKLYIKDPQDTKFGNKLLHHAILLLAEIGFESFTFKKLAQKMSSAEVSIYRYFENKHFLLLYLNCWYWEWVQYLIEKHVTNINDPKEKLQRAIHSIIYASRESVLTDYINENKLYEIIQKESSKSYHIQDVDKENEDGLFIPYKTLVGKLASIILEINPAFDYPRSLSSTIFEMTNNQIYYAEHLPRLTDLKDIKNKFDDLEKMVNRIAIATIENA